MAKKVLVFSCSQCGNQAPKWLGRCPECNAWNSYLQEAAAEPGASTTGFHSAAAPVPIDSVSFDNAPRISTSLRDLDRVLGGGLVSGAVTLVGGEPGVGKSTLLLQVAEKLALHGLVLYVSGEESPRQIALRARRLNTLNSNIVLYPETSVEKIVAQIDKLRPAAVIIDSIQTVHTALSSSTPGSVGQVRDSAGLLMTTAKQLSIPIFLIGHITKDGSIAGPKSLEHIVDTVLYFEGDKFQNVRLLRAYKNRFGPANEVALYQMHDTGLEEVSNPSAALIAQRSTAPGSAIVAAVEGTRPILVEVQGLVSPTHFPSPRRMAMGIESNRLALLVAVLEKKNGANFVTQDIYLNIAGGLQLDEPAIDLGVIAALISSQQNRPIPAETVVFGEVGLLGEIRGVSQPELRAREAAALGFKRLICASADAREIRSDLKVIGVQRIEEFAERCFL